MLNTTPQYALKISIIDTIVRHIGTLVSRLAVICRYRGCPYEVMQVNSKFSSFLERSS
jgi:hypothetical protein